MGWSMAGSWVLPGGAFVGSILTVALVYALARGSGGTLPIHSLLLAGVVVGAVLSSLLMFVVSVAPPERVHNVIWWLLGNLQIFDWGLLRAAAVLVACGLGITILLARDLNLMTLGEESATHLGLNVNQSRVLFFVLASLITGAVVAAAGLIGFVGLIVPHSVRLAIGPDHRRLAPASALVGATFLVLADAFGRTIMAPVEIPIGVVTACLGGPFFLFLLKQKRRA
jgi:iron complex transport system permease protein